MIKTSTGVFVSITTAVVVLLTATTNDAANVATDNAADSAYGGGWTNGSNGGTGFGPWSQLVSFVNPNNDGFFLGSSSTNGAAPPSGDIDTSGKSWGLYANGNNGVYNALAEAYRPFTGGALAVGQTITLKMDNGLIDSPGIVGFSLLAQDPASSNNPFLALPNNGTRFSFVFYGGQSDYLISLGDPVSNSNTVIQTGVPYTDGGLTITFTLHTNDTFSVNINGSAPITGSLGGQAYQAINGIALFDFIAGSGNTHDAFFNSLAVLQPTPQSPANLALDTAADSAYAGGWTNASSGGYGWGGPWYFSTGMSGNAGEFLGTSQANGPNDGNINTLQRSWGLWANSGGYITARRDFRQALQPGQSFVIDMDNGYIDSSNSVGIAMTGNGDPRGAAHFGFFFRGGDINYTISTGYQYSYLETNTGVGFTSKGVHVVLTLDDAAGNYHCAITPSGGDTTVISGTGLAASEGLGHVELFNSNAGSGPERDVFFNKIAIVPAPRVTGIQVVGGTNAVVNFMPSRVLHHVVQSRDDLTAGTWSVIASNLTGSGETTLQVPDFFAPGQLKRFYRVKASP